MKRFIELCNECLPDVEEIFPWDLEDAMQEGRDMLILDVREPYEFNTMHIDGSMNVPRGILETAVEWDYEETEPELVQARDRRVVVVCRSGNRSLLAGKTMKIMGFKDVLNLKTGLRGWNDYELPLVDEAGDPVALEEGDAYFATKLMPEQRRPSP